MSVPPHSLESLIRLVPDFPVQGVLFRDIVPLLHAEYRATIDAMASLFSVQEWQHVDAVVGIEARGFLLASGLAYAHDKSLLVVRKPGKLPPPVFEQNYSLEYGRDVLQMSVGLAAQRVLVVDDVLATGGTMGAACRLCARAGHQVAGLTTLINLTSLNEFHWHGQLVRSLWSYV